MEIKWIFFDVGSTLVDENAAHDRRAREMLSETDIPFSHFHGKRIELAREGFDGNSAAIKFFGLTKTPWPSEEEVLFSDAKETLEVLKTRGYKLGIIANQNAGLSRRLESFGILQYFDVVAASAEIGASKPDRSIFEAALRMAGCSPVEAVMVGDRLDNDVFPAKDLGMKTVWIRGGLAAYQDTSLARGKSDFIIDKLDDLCLIFS